MKILLKTCMISLLLASLPAFSATKSVGEIVEPKHEELIKMIVKEECGYKRPMRVASGMLGNPPFAWEEYGNRQHTTYKSFGLGLEVIDDLSKKLGFRYETTGYPTYEAALKALRLGEVDVLFGVYYSTKLGSGIKQITPGYFKNVFTTFVKKGSEAEEHLKNVKTFNDLMGWKGVVREEEEIFPQIKDRVKNLKVAVSAPKVFDMLLKGEVDYLITSPYSIEAELRRHKLQKDIIPVGDVIFQSNLFFTFSTNTNCTKMASEFGHLLKEAGMTNTQKDTILRQIIDDWGNRFRGEEGLKEKQERERMAKESFEDTDKEPAEEKVEESEIEE